MMNPMTTKIAWDRNSAAGSFPLASNPGAVAEYTISSPIADIARYVRTSTRSGLKGSSFILTEVGRCRVRSDISQSPDPEQVRSHLRAH